MALSTIARGYGLCVMSGAGVPGTPSSSFWVVQSYNDTTQTISTTTYSDADCTSIDPTTPASTIELKGLLGKCQAIPPNVLKGANSMVVTVSEAEAPVLDYASYGTLLYLDDTCSDETTMVAAQLTPVTGSCAFANAHDGNSYSIGCNDATPELLLFSGVSDCSGASKVIALGDAPSNVASQFSLATQVSCTPSTDNTYAKSFVCLGGSGGSVWPTETPTDAPTDVPTHLPTKKPVAPPKKPSAKPTAAPTTAAQKSPAPTSMPVSLLAPSAKPTAAPTSAAQKSPAPSPVPTKATSPSAKPSLLPTYFPTLAKGFASCYQGNSLQPGGPVAQAYKSGAFPAVECVSYCYTCTSSDAASVTACPAGKTIQVFSLVAASTAQSMRQLPTTYAGLRECTTDNCNTPAAATPCAGMVPVPAPVSAPVSAPTLSPASAPSVPSPSLSLSLSPSPRPTEGCGPGASNSAASSGSSSSSSSDGGISTGAKAAIGVVVSVVVVALLLLAFRSAAAKRAAPASWSGQPSPKGLAAHDANQHQHHTTFHRDNAMDIIPEPTAPHRPSQAPRVVVTSRLDPARKHTDAAHDQIYPV